MKTFRIVLTLTLMLSAVVIAAPANAHPNQPGYCQMPDGTLTPGHCDTNGHAAGGHDVHLPAAPVSNPPNSNGPGSGPPGSGPNGDPNSGPNGDPNGGSNGGSGGGSNGGSGSTPVYTGENCHISHAATPAQICSVAGGMQYWYIGADGSAQPGPFLPDEPKIESFSGTNPLTGKAVTIDYVTENDQLLLRVQTYYPDNEYDTNKPYVFTLDPGHNVNHIQW